MFNFLLKSSFPRSLRNATEFMKMQQQHLPVQSRFEIDRLRALANKKSAFAHLEATLELHKELAITATFTRK